MAGNITNRTLENGTSSAYRIDQLNRQSAIQHNLVGGAKRFDYAFNSVSDITAVQRDSALGDGYTYDLTQQITGFQQNGTVNLAAGTVSTPATTNNMLFDGCGNRTSLNGVGQTFDNLNRLTTTAGTIYNSNSALTAWNI